MSPETQTLGLAGIKSRKDDGSQEETAYKSLKAEGFINLYGNGHIMNPVHNGPFALLLDFYEGDSRALEQAFRAVGQAE